MTPFLWAFIGAGLGGFWGVEAMGYSTWPLLALPALVLLFLSARAWRNRSRRTWLDLAGFCIGAGGLAAVFLLPSGFSTQVCSGFSASGACDAAGTCTSSAPTFSGCTTNYSLAIETSAYLLLLVFGCLIALWPTLRLGAARLAQRAGRDTP